MTPARRHVTFIDSGPDGLRITSVTADGESKAMNTLGKAIAAALLCVGVAAPALGAVPDANARGTTRAVQGESVITMRLDGEISVDPQGRVHDYTIRTDTTPGVQKLLDHAIPSWRFEPVLVNGAPVIARSPMRVVVAATQTGKDYSIRIDNVLFRPNTDEEIAADLELRAATDGFRIRSQKMQPPSYPPVLLHNGVEAMVLLNLRLNPDGSVGDVIAEQSSLLNVKGPPARLERARAHLEHGAVANARHWRFRIEAPDPAALSASDLTVRVPVSYAIGTKQAADFAGTWRYEYRGPRHTAPWLENSAKDVIVGVSDLSSGEMLSGSPSLRLLNRDQALGASAP